MKRTLVALATAVAVTFPAVAVASPANAASTWTTVRSVSQSQVAFKVIFRDGSFWFTQPGQSVHYHRSESWEIQRGLDVCWKISANGGSFWFTTIRNYRLKDGVQYAVKAWQDSRC